MENWINELTEEQKIDVAKHGYNTFAEYLLDNAKEVNTEFCNERRWYLDYKIVFELNGKLYLSEISTTKDECGEDEYGQTYEVEAVEKIVKTIEYIRK